MKCPAICISRKASFNFQVLEKIGSSLDPAQPMNRAGGHTQPSAQSPSCTKFLDFWHNGLKGFAGCQDISRGECICGGVNQGRSKLSSS